MTGLEKSRSYLSGMLVLVRGVVGTSDQVMIFSRRRFATAIYLHYALVVCDEGSKYVCMYKYALTMRLCGN